MNTAFIIARTLLEAWGLPSGPGLSESGARLGLVPYDQGSQANTLTGWCYSGSARLLARRSSSFFYAWLAGSSYRSKSRALWVVVLLLANFLAFSLFFWFWVYQATERSGRSTGMRRMANRLPPRPEAYLRTNRVVPAA